MNDKAKTQLSNQSSTASQPERDFDLLLNNCNFKASAERRAISDAEVPIMLIIFSERIKRELALMQASILLRVVKAATLL